MLGILFKKQMSELNQSFFQDRKKGKRRSAVSTAALVLLYLSLLVCLGGIFFLCRQSTLPAAATGRNRLAVFYHYGDDSSGVRYIWQYL